jgi:hypothetical protein
MYEPVIRTCADMQRLYRLDYNTNDNPLSPVYTIPDVVLESVLLNDEQKLQMFEKRVSMNCEIRAYRCPIASVKNYKIHENNVDNIVYASWLFHQYFDGLMTAGIPCLLVRVVKMYTPTTFQIDGCTVKRQRIEVLMDFTTDDGLNEILPTLNEGCELRGPKQLQTYIYASNAEQMCRFF